jgi:preprotein translocase subunit YajC
MTSSQALIHAVLAASSSSKTSSSSAFLTLLPLLAIGVLGYFFFIRPQQRKAQAAREQQKSGIEVGDEVQTVGGIIGTVLEIHGDRYTLLTGALGDDGNLDGPQPTRIVFVRQAIARKVDPVEDIRLRDQPVVDDEDEDEEDDERDDGVADEDIHDIRGGRSGRGGQSGRNNRPEGAIGDVRERAHDDDEGGTASGAEEA